jgi:hypothetical protein
MAATAAEQEVAEAPVAETVHMARPSIAPMRPTTSAHSTSRKIHRLPMLFKATKSVVLLSHWWTVFMEAPKSHPNRSLRNRRRKLPPCAFLAPPASRRRAPRSTSWHSLLSSQFF